MDGRKRVLLADSSEEFPLGSASASCEALSPVQKSTAEVTLYTCSFVKTSVYLTDTEILCQVKVGFHEVHFLFFRFHTEFTGQILGA